MFLARVAHLAARAGIPRVLDVLLPPVYSFSNKSASAL